MASNYVRGRAKEYEIRNTLEAMGYTTTRSASSQGLWDVDGVRLDGVVLVQGKLTSDGSFSEDENCQKLRDLPVPHNVRKELWIYVAGEGLVEVRDLKRPKPDARTAEGKALREEFRAAAAQVKRIKNRKR